SFERHLISLCSIHHPISVANMVWTRVHQDFAMRAYLENNQSVIVTERATTPFLMQTQFGHGLGGWRKLVPRLE
ncbi:Hypothetical predicted protein, partial [Pelobates cultripes]